MFNWKGFLISSVFIFSSVYAKDAFIVRFELTDSMKLYLRQNEFDITGVNYKTKEIEALLTLEELELIKAQKANIKFSFPGFLAMRPDSEYKNPQEIENFLKETHDRFPQTTELKIIGKSLEGRNIWAIKISDNANEKEPEPVVLINAMHHAREVMTPEVATDLVAYLTSNYGSDSDVTRWVDNTEIWVIPMFNVDGNEKVWSEDSMWRKNTRNGYGVDINRNYPTGWNSCNGSSGSTWAQDYRGTTPASEPETQAMMAFVASIKPVFNISYHSYSELVLYPFGCSPKRTPVGEAIESIGKEMAKKLNYTPGTPWELLYNADGGDMDWMYTEHQVIPYVIEVNSTSEGFQPDYAKWRDKTVLRNRSAWMHLLNRLNGPSLQGTVSVGEFDLIKISQDGSKDSHTYKINPDGGFYIILTPGTYNFLFQGKEKQKVFSKILITEKKVIDP